MNHSEVLKEAFDSDMKVLETALDSDKKLVDLTTNQVLSLLMKIGRLTDLLVTKGILTTKEAEHVLSSERDIKLEDLFTVEDVKEEGDK